MRKSCKFVTSVSEADEIWFAGCGVRYVWVEDAIYRINLLLQNNPAARVIVTGCLAKIDTKKIAAMVNTDSIEFREFNDILCSFGELSLTELDSQYSQNETTDFQGCSSLRRRISLQKESLVSKLEELDSRYGTRLAHFYKRSTKGYIFYQENEPVEFITVTRGCPYQCSYCVIPLGRGRYTSTPLDTVVTKAKTAIANGRFKIYLIGDEVGNYGVDKQEVKLDRLLNAVFSLDKRVRIGIRFIEPIPFIKFYEYLLHYCQEDRIDLLYVPIQSGSESTLLRMKRFYTIDNVAKKLACIRQNTNTVLYTNWMVGFPGETDIEFQHTANLVKTLKLHVNAIVPFSEREGTLAASMKQKLGVNIIKKRAEVLNSIAQQLKIDLLSEQLSFMPEQERKVVLEMVAKAEWIPADSVF